MDMKAYLQKLLSSVSGLHAIVISDRDAVPIIKVSTEQAPELSLRQNFLCTFSTASEQANKVGFKQSKSIVSFYKNYQVIQVNKQPVVVTFIADADANTGIILSLQNDLKEVIEDIYSVVGH